MLPVEPARDKSGYYCHPAVPDFDEDPNAIANWVYEQQLTINTQLLFDEPTDSEAFDNYFNQGGGAEKWQPDAPAGDGWFMLALFDTDDGPVCWWARHNFDHKVLTLHGRAAVA